VTRRSRSRAAFRPFVAPGPRYPSTDSNNQLGTCRGSLLHQVNNTLTSIAKLDFSAQDFGALGAPWIHYVGSPLIHATHDPQLVRGGGCGGTAYGPGIYACISGLWGVLLTRVHPHLLSNSIDNQDGQLPRSRYNRVGFMFVTLLVVLS
jgi:hypothetical protein